MTQTLVFPEGHFRHFISVEEFYRMTRAGVFPEGVRFELLEGEIFELEMVNDVSAGLLGMLSEEIRVKLARSVRVYVRMPIVLERPTSEPEPDLTVVMWDSEIRRKPRVHEVLAVVEISDSSLNKDRGIKQRVYARAGIPEYWIVNVNDVQLEIYRNPGPTEYKLRQTLERGELAHFAAFPGVDIQWW